MNGAEIVNNKHGCHWDIKFDPKLLIGNECPLHMWNALLSSRTMLPFMEALSWMQTLCKPQHALKNGFLEKSSAVTHNNEKPCGLWTMATIQHSAKPIISLGFFSTLKAVLDCSVTKWLWLGQGFVGYNNWFVRWKAVRFANVHYLAHLQVQTLVFFSLQRLW